MASNLSNISSVAYYGRWYDLDVNKLVILLWLVDWRHPLNIKFLQALAAPLKRIHYEFKKNREYNLYRIRHNWMKCYMEKALNDEFDPQQRRITIDEGAVYDHNYIYTHAEDKPKFLGTMYLRTSGEYSDNGSDFTVNMHGVQANIYDIRALVDFYRIDGPRYRVINMYQFDTVFNP